MTPFASGQAVPGNFELTGSLPEWIELLEPGREIVGRDGRTFINADPDGVVKNLRALGLDLLIDFEHASELRAPKGEEAPAAGWVTEYEHRGGGSIWGKVDWTPRGHAAVVNREYRFISPVIIYSRADGAIHSLASIALTNKPNLRNTALNSLSGGAFPSLSEQEIKIASLFGNSPEDILKFKAVEAARNAAEARMTTDEVKICRMLGNRPEEIAAVKVMESARNAIIAGFTEDEMKIAAMFGNSPGEVRSIMAGDGDRRAAQAANRIEIPKAAINEVFNSPGVQRVCEVMKIGEDQARALIEEHLRSYEFWEDPYPLEVAEGCAWMNVAKSDFLNAAEEHDKRA